MRTPPPSRARRAPAGRAALAFLAVAALASSCALFERGPAALDPVGTFQFETRVQGQPASGTLEISGSAGEYEGRIVPVGLGTGPISLSAVAVEGQELHLQGSVMGERLEIRLHFEGDEFQGRWSAGVEAGEIRGARTG